MASAVAKDGARIFDSTDSGPAAPDSICYAEVGNLIVSFAFAFDSEFHIQAPVFLYVYIYIYAYMPLLSIYKEFQNKTKTSQSKRVSQT